MRIQIQRRGLIPALIVAIIGTWLLYLASTAGLSAFQQSRADPRASAGTLPSVVENAPSSVGTTETSGPLGAISLVFAGTDVRDGLLGELERPWIAVASNGGTYRALDAPHLPEAGTDVMSASHDGTQLAWPGGDGVVVYDAVTGESSELAIDGGADVVGAFSPDSSTVLVHGDGLSAVDTDSGEVVATVEADADVVRRIAWRPDSSAVDYVAGGELTTVGVPGGATSTQSTDIPEQAALAWAPSGDQLVSLQEADGVKLLYASPAERDGTVGTGEEVPTPGISLQRLIAFSGDRNVAVVAFVQESGNIERILDIRLDGRSPSDLTTLASPGDNWVSTETLAVASDTLIAGSTDFDDPLWPWSYTSRLVACALFMLFLFGLYITRRRRT